MLKGGFATEDARLDRVPSATMEHIDKYPLQVDGYQYSGGPSSMVAGINWYGNFDSPVPLRVRGANRMAIGAGDLGRIRGGHAVCLRHRKLRDLTAWWHYYNQLAEGRCVEFAKLRMLTQMDRIRYDITSRWHYHTAQESDEWRGCYLGHDGEAYEGTSVRAGLEVLRAHGAIRSRPRGAAVSAEEAPTLVDPARGIQTYRWATSWDQVRQALEVPDYMPGVPMNNSWGRSYPREVLLLDEAGERVLREDGEFGIVSDR